MSLTRYRATLRAAAGISLCIALAACGGGNTETPPQAKAQPSESESAPDNSAVGTETQANLRLAARGSSHAGPPNAQTVAAQKEGARLNTQELSRIAQTGVLPKASGGPLLSGAQNKSGLQGTAKAASTRTAVYRFYNTATGAHFFTTSETERDTVKNTLSPPFNYENTAFYASPAEVPGLSPVYRFYNTQTGVHFYTISEEERAHTLATLPQFNLEGIAYYASTLPGSGYTPLYRFFYASKGFHFYTNSAAEKDNIIATLPHYTYEGIGYYVLGENWVKPAVPHTGVDASNCFGTTFSGFVVSDFLGGCTSVLNFPVFNNQDGQRTAINPMSYSAVGSAPLTDCVKDNVTGLVWEGKASAGLFAGSNTYTKAQADAYVSLNNSAGLCGFNDWRLPTQEELQSIVHYGLSGGLRINTAWFPNTQGGDYWSSEAYLATAGEDYWVTSFVWGHAEYRAPGVSNHVRLVRGAPWIGPRHMVTTVAYGGDAANNAVIDRKTGLSWRRCLEGQSWNGSACTGAAATYTHRQALQRADSQSGWRLPNVKELGSLPDRSRVSPALPVLGATVLFPGAGSDAWTWASSPYVGSAGNAWDVDFSNGSVYGNTRNYYDAVRLVRASQ